MTAPHRLVALTAAGSWTLALGWPVAGALYQPLALARVPGLHIGLLFLAASLTIVSLGSKLVGTHLHTFACGVLFGQVQREDATEDNLGGRAAGDEIVVNLRPRRPRH